MNYYQRLQVDPKASQEVIKRVYRVLLKQARMHPDLGGDEDDAKAVNEAYEVIGDPEQRARYDRELNLTFHYRAPPAPPQYILFCGACGKANRVSDEALVPRARCGVCHRKLAPSGAQLAGMGHERPFRLGMYLFEKGLLDRSLREFQTAARLKPGNAIYRYWLGRCYYRKRIYEKATIEFRVAASLKPDSFQFQFWLGQTLYKADKLAGAAKAFERAAEFRPDHTPTFHRLGSAYYHLRQFDQAIQAFTRAVHLDPRGLQSQKWLGLSYYANNDPEGALHAFRNAEKLAPGDPFSEKYISLLNARSA